MEQVGTVVGTADGDGDGKEVWHDGKRSRTSYVFLLGTKLEIFISSSSSMVESSSKERLPDQPLESGLKYATLPETELRVPKVDAFTKESARQSAFPKSASIELPMDVKSNLRQTGPFDDIVEV